MCISYRINCHYLMYYTSHLFQHLTQYFVILLLPYLFFWQVNNKKAKQSIMCCWSKCIFMIQQINSSAKAARCQEEIEIAMDTWVSVGGHSEGTQPQPCSLCLQRKELLVTQSMAVHPLLQLELQPWLPPPDNLLSFPTPLRLKDLVPSTLCSHHSSGLIQDLSKSQ